MRTICCLCKKIKGVNGWAKGNEAPDNRVSHGYCPQCFEKTIRAMRRHLRLTEKEVEERVRNTPA